ncbi:MAG: GH1 family beta-glucosidase [Aestuariibacter sp.]
MKLTIAKDSPLRQSSFTFGAATASFQIEGGIEQRDPCIWDTFCNQPGTIRDNSNGDVACDHYHRWQEDVKLIASLGVDAYRFSISWPRVMDEHGQLKDEGITFYARLLDALAEQGIKAYVTLYHWDLPQYLEDKGGWLNRDTAYAFEHYVDKVSAALGDRVFSFATLNEPFCSAYLGYELGIHAPGKTGVENGRTAAHHLMLAHGLGMGMLRKNAPHCMNGIVLNVSPSFPATNDPRDILAARQADDLLNQWYFQPILTGSYPHILENLPEEYQPPIKEGDMAIINAELDFLGINYYTREIYMHDEEKGFKAKEQKTLPTTEMGWEVYPSGLLLVLDELNRRYKLPPVYITENGAAMSDTLEDGQIYDVERVDYYQHHLEAVENAIKKGVDVQGYFAWSLMDNFEWAEGYKKRFGIVYVDYETQQRYLKESGKAYQAFLQSRNQ